jgi:Tfp pilus assembly protein PilZ
VTEPILHQWKPEADLVPPPPSSFDQPSWESLPTISPAALEVRQEEETIAEAVAAPEPVSETATGPVENTEQPDVAKPVPTSKPGGGETTEQLPLEKSISQQTQPPSQVVPMEPVQTPDQPEESPANRRATERTEQSIPISFDNLTSLIKEFTHNISFGGLFVYTDRPLEKGKEVAVTLVHPVHGERLTLLSIVAHSSSAPSPDPVSGAPRYGVGVQFRIPLEELKRLLSDFIGSHQKAKPVEEHDNLIEQAQVILNRGARSHHDLLGVNSLAKQDEIRRAYFELVDRFHPDRYYGKVSEASQKVLEELFRNLTKAYEALTT